MTTPSSDTSRVPWRNLAPLTHVSYASDLKHLNRYLAERPAAATIDRVRPHHLAGYLAALDADGLNGSFHRRRVATNRLVRSDREAPLSS